MSCFTTCGLGLNSSSLAGSSSSSSSSTSSRLQSSLRLQPEVQPVTVAVLGAPGVGKTSLVQQFLRSEFEEEYEASKSTQAFYTSIIINDHLYELKLVDCSGAVRFPVNSLQEWNEHRGHGLRNASAYVIVYDVTDEDSFRFARSVRERIVSSRNTHDVPLIVVANKLDLQLHGGTSGGAAQGSTTFGEKLGQGTSRRDLGNIVRKQWKCCYVECSAKYNWRVVALFRELMKAIDSVTDSHKMASSRVQEALRNNRCVIL